MYGTPTTERGGPGMPKRAIRRRALTLIAAALLMQSGPAAAASLPWEIAPTESRIDFDYVRNGTPDEGQFVVFRGTGSFDREDPGSAKLTLEIDSKSIHLSDPVASAFATSAEWFDSANHPHVVYRLIRLVSEGGNIDHALGDLTIRGKTKPVETTITLDIGDGEAHASGELQVDRTDYLLGIGPSALFVSIGERVAVRFDLMAHPLR